MWMYACVVCMLYMRTRVYICDVHIHCMCLYVCHCVSLCVHLYATKVSMSLCVQGTSIPPLIQVDLELQGTEVLFSPPLTSTSASRSIPEAVQQWLSHYMDLSKLVRRVAHDSEVLTHSPPPPTPTTTTITTTLASTKLPHYFNTLLLSPPISPSHHSTHTYTHTYTHTHTHTHTPVLLCCHQRRP